MPVPGDRQFTAQHEWVQIEGAVARVGITDFATSALGDVVYLELPQVGSSLIADSACGEIESTKSVSDLFAPLDGSVLEINELAVGDPSRVNADPYGDGWLFTMSVEVVKGLLDAAQYRRLTQEDS